MERFSPQRSALSLTQVRLPEPSASPYPFSCHGGRSDPCISKRTILANQVYHILNSSYAEISDLLKFCGIFDHGSAPATAAERIIGNEKGSFAAHGEGTVFGRDQKMGL